MMSEKTFNKIVVNIYYDEDIPDPHQRYVAEICDEHYRGCVTGDSIPSLFEILSYSMRSIDAYKVKL